MDQDVTGQAQDTSTCAAPARPRLRQVVLDSTDARRSAEFWRALLGLRYRPGHEPVAGEPDPAWLDRAELDAVHLRVLALGGPLLLDRADDPEEPLRAYGDPDGHPSCVFVST